MIARQQKNMLRHLGSIGLLALAVLVNLVLVARIAMLEDAWKEDVAQYQNRLAWAEYVRDLAVQELGAISLQQEKERKAREDQAAAYAALDGCRYIGECTITAYCPCVACCGQWADGLTASGIPAVSGMVEVDKSIIPLGSTVIIDGQRYLAADTGVTGNLVDVFMPEHSDAVQHGVRTADVWVVAE